ncbi:hypothetical protein SAMN04487928_102168 [Butyrivibrio proteoclasticus]|uniref:Uncharacterized protein n=1 Tax=Butyrivibrio proteoclasticus TaxID=43305 RepID=A0A1I5QK14_9FIRM|nr:DUF6115 domain-containing protein [Butyrivibrio proteoclasticus]SFP46582.1 hypothetical protein SAMN04487928_102168 [Butyrivibrio proteoclasticus]
MISITEIVLIVAGFAAIILGYLLPATREIDEGEKSLMEREIRELVRREVEDQKETIENMVDDSVDISLDRTERAMERISNEKLSAIGEYSDTVINDIHKNHDEVMFMYDMLNDKHKNLTSVVSEVAKKTDEAKQAVLDAEATAREAAEKAESLKSIQEVVTPDRHLRAILLDEDKDTLSGIQIPYKEKSAPPPVPKAEKQVAAPKIDKKPSVESGYIDKGNIKDLNELGSIPAQFISRTQAAGLHVIGNTGTEQSEPKDIVSAKVVSISEGKTTNPDRNMRELTAIDPASQNKQIIEMHKAGKSNMVIARELGLGIGEVKLVIDLSNKHRKVK